MTKKEKMKACYRFLRSIEFVLIERQYSIRNYLNILESSSSLKYFKDIDTMHKNASKLRELRVVINQSTVKGGKALFKENKLKEALNIIDEFHKNIKVCTKELKSVEKIMTKLYERSKKILKDKLNDELYVIKVETPFLLIKELNEILNNFEEKKKYIEEVITIDNK